MTSTTSISKATILGPTGEPLSDRQKLIKVLRTIYVPRGEDQIFTALASDMADRTLAEREGRALIVSGPSGAGKTTLINYMTRKHPDLGKRRMIFVQVPPACALADLGAEIARAAGYPVRDGLKSSVAWGAAMRRIHDKKIKFVWIDEVQNITELANVREARKIRNVIKMSLINRRHTLGLILSGDTSISTFLRSDAHILRRSDVMSIAPVGPDMFETIAQTIRAMAERAGMTTAPDLESQIVPRLVHAALKQFGTALETARMAIVRAVDGRQGPNGKPVLTLTLEHFALSWARAHDVGADRNPFVHPKWADLDVAAILAAGRERILVPSREATR